MKPKEFILCAAIDYDGIIICGHRHGDCYETLIALIGVIDVNKLPNHDKQGFLTSKNRYVSREDAWMIAEENNQIKFGYEASKQDDTELREWLGLENPVKPMLISENLY